MSIKIKFLIGQRVIFKDMINKGTSFASSVDVICIVCMSENPHKKDFDYWIDNPARGYKHGVSQHNIEPMPYNQI